MFCFSWLSARAFGPAAIVALGLSLCSLCAAATAQPGETALPGPVYVAPAIAVVAPDRQPTHKVNRVWIASLLAVAGATAADAATSWGYRESNGVLQSSNGTFGPRGVGIKLGAVSALLVPEILLRKHRDLQSKFAAGNFVVAGIFGGTSIYNVHAAATQTVTSTQQH